MTHRPCIGVTSSSRRGRHMWWLYWMSLELLGAHPVRLVATAGDIDERQFDGLIIGAGDDIGAGLDQGAPTMDVRIDPARDALELNLLERAAPIDMPVLGVCRGAQMLNVFYGGSLHQDVRQAKMWTPLRNKDVQLVEGSRLAGIMGKAPLRVNSLDRQAVDRVGAGLSVSGRDEFDVVRAIEDPSASFRMGVQWHPEFLIYRERQRALFKSFVDAVRRFAAKREERISTAPLIAQPEPYSEAMELALYYDPGRARAAEVLNSHFTTGVRR